MPTALSDVYALAFGNITESGEIDDLSISDNGDRNKILATVATALDIYTKRHPDRMIYFMGSTKQKNMEINAFLIKRKPLNPSLAKCPPFS